MEMYGMSGERLGTIGSESVALNDPPPTWMRELSTRPSVSVRHGIAWAYNQPYEDTDTLVLTAVSGKFVDLRLPKSVESPADVLLHPSFWAFSGTATTTFYNRTSPDDQIIPMPYTAHCVFVHDLDSRGPGIQDEGDVLLLPNKDCIEVGSMLNPSNGRIQMYKEYWTSTQHDHVEPQSVLVRCIVAEICGRTGSPVSGIMIAHREYVQALIHDTKSEDISRLAWARYQLSPSSWDRDRRSTLELPMNWVTADGRVVGDEHAAAVDDLRWRIIEIN